MWLSFGLAAGKRKEEEKGREGGGHEGKNERREDVQRVGMGGILL